MHRAVTLALKKMACDLIIATTGADAERMILEQRPQIVLLDWDLPEKSGIELCREIKTNPQLEASKVILLLSSFEKLEDAELESVPSDGRLWKPFEAHVLLALIETLLKADFSNAEGGGTVSAVVESTAPLRLSPRGPAEETAPLTMPPPLPKRAEASSSTRQLSSRTSKEMPPRPSTPPPVPPSQRPTASKASGPLPAVEETAKLPAPPRPGKQRGSIAELFRPNIRELTNPGKEVIKEMTEATFGGAFDDDTSFPEEAEEFKNPSPDEQRELMRIRKTIDDAQRQEAAFADDAENSASASTSNALWESPVPENAPTDEGFSERIALPKHSEIKYTSPGRSIPGLAEQQAAMNRSTAAKATPQGEDIRRIVAAEIEQKFRPILREELEKQLARVLDELNEIDG